MTTLNDRPSLFRHPHYAGQFTIYPSPHQPVANGGVYLVDKAQLRNERILEWVAQDTDDSPHAKAALQGYLYASQHITAHNAVDGNERFAAGSFTNGQFKHFVANLTAQNAFTARGARRPGDALLSLEHVARQAAATILDVASRPLPNAIHALIQLGVFEPKAGAALDLDRETEVQRLIHLGSDGGRVPGALIDAQVTALRDELYGMYIGEWLAAAKPELVQTLPALSLPITRYLSGALATLQQIKPGNALHQDFLGFPKGTAVSTVQSRLDELGRSYTNGAGLNAGSVIDGKDAADRFTVSVIHQTTNPADPRDSQSQTLMFSRRLDHFQLQQAIDGSLISYGELIEYDGEPVGSFTSGQQLSADEQSVTQTWVLLEAVNGHSVTREMVAAVAETFELNLSSPPEPKHQTTMKMG